MKCSCTLDRSDRSPAEASHSRTGVLQECRAQGRKLWGVRITFVRELVFIPCTRCSKEACRLSHLQ